MKTILFIICFSISQILFCQVTFIVNEFPEDTLDSNSIYISGDFEGWSGGQDQFKLKKSKKQYSITIPKHKEAIDFKFTLGTWDTVECNKEGGNIENRTYFFNKPNDTVYVSISRWSSPSEIKTLKPSTAAGNVYVFSDYFKIPQLNRTRKISIYFPPDYNATSKRYPVLYMLDGQNVFDKATSYSGEWEVDERLNELYYQKKGSYIAVAIDHGVENRLHEYSAWDNDKYGKGEGEAFLDFIVNNLKPEIDKHCRTKSGSENTAIIGSSMGGLFAQYAALKYPDVFGKVGVFSPAFWYAPAINDYAKGQKLSNNQKIFFLAGGKEGGNTQFEEINQTVQDMNTMVDILKDKGFPSKNIQSKVVPEGRHNEELWKNEFEEAILWLFSE